MMFIKACRNSGYMSQVRTLRSFHWTGSKAFSSQQQQQKSSPKTKITSKDTRLAGRLRFYKSVGIVPVPPPWETNDNNSNSKISKQKSVESPISAGVDGTQSASGVTNTIQNDKLQYMLTPRTPGSTDIISSSSLNDYSPSWFGVTLDGRTVKTPMGQTLALPSSMLAMAIAAEWDAQIKYIQPAQMPLMTLSCTALDQVASHPLSYQEQSLNFLSTDTTCYWSDPTEDRVLYRRQEQAWSDLHDFVQTKFNNHKPAIASGSIEGLLMSRGARSHKQHAGLPHDLELYQLAEDYITSLDAWHLIAFFSLASEAKSFLVAMAVLEQQNKKSPFSQDLSKAIEASRVEEEFQISNWGLVEGGHDYDRLNCSIQFRSARVLTSTIKMEQQLEK